MAKVAFLGLGVMGYPMARHLKSKGHDVTVYNRTAAKAEKWASEHGGAVARTPQEAAKGQEIVFSCVGNDDDLRQVTIGPDGAFAGVERGAIFVDHTTASAEVARELHAQAQQKGFGFVDAPVSGGQAGAENGALVDAVESPVGPDRHLAQVVVVADAGEHDFLTDSRLFRGAGEAAAVIRDPFLRLGGRAVVDGDVVTLALEVSGHGVAHDA